MLYRRCAGRIAPGQMFLGLFWKTKDHDPTAAADPPSHLAELPRRRILTPGDGVYDEPLLKQQGADLINERLLYTGSVCREAEENAAAGTGRPPC